jgi:hypothetical protein
MTDAAGDRRRGRTYFLYFGVIRKCRSRMMAAIRMLRFIGVQEIRMRQCFLATATLRGRTKNISFAE